jgi:hypothetical protein
LKAFLQLGNSKVFIGDKPLIYKFFFGLDSFSHPQCNSLPSCKGHRCVKAFRRNRKVIILSTSTK